MFSICSICSGLIFILLDNPFFVVMEKDGIENAIVISIFSNNYI